MRMLLWLHTNGLVISSILLGIGMLIEFFWIGAKSNWFGHEFPRRYHELLHYIIWGDMMYGTVVFLVWVYYGLDSIGHFK
jgi:hypothetical protein